MIASPLRMGSCDPFQMAFPWLINGGLPTTCNHGMILQVGGLPGISCHLNDLRPQHLSFQSYRLETRKRDANRDGIFKWESTSFCCGKSSSKVALGRDMLVPRRVIKWLLELVVGDSFVKRAKDGSIVSVQKKSARKFQRKIFD